MKKEIDVHQKLQTVFSAFMDSPNPQSTYEDRLDLLIQVVDIFRPYDPEQVVDITPLIQFLSNNEQYLTSFVLYTRQLFYKKDFSQIITDAGIINYTDFLYEIRKRIVQQILPMQPKFNTMQFILNQVFYNKTDYRWVSRISRKSLLQLFDLCACKTIYDDQKLSYEMSRILYSLELLTQRITGKALETEVNKMVPEYQNFDSPFIGLLRELSELIDSTIRGQSKRIDEQNLNYKQVKILHQQCVQYIDTAFQNAHKYGISLQVNQSLLRIRQQLDRVNELLPILIQNGQDSPRHKTIDFALLLIKYNCYKNNVKQLIRESTQLLSYEVTQHTAETGEHYITKTKSEYFNMLKSASGGGLIVGFLCLFKILLAKLDTSAFGAALLNSLNYSFGFILIYLTGATLATKQPAMTASALVKALEKASSHKTGVEQRYWNFAIFFSRVFRSQFIAFIGNVLIAFPVALALVWGLDALLSINVATQKASKLVYDLSPWHTKAVFHAAIAGVFLFISGIIAGSVANRDKHNGVYYRIQQHPLLKKAFGKERTLRFAKWYEHKWAGIVSNFWFGVCMGSTASIGAFIGLDLDIRHITFASGNFALGLYGAHFHIHSDMIFWSVLGIGVIGFVNFIVSFTLSLSLAFRSRNMPINELKVVTLAVWEYFKVKPMDFFFPPKQKELESNTKRDHS